MRDRVREAVRGYGPMTEVEVPGGLEFEWDGDALARVIDGEPFVRVEDGWTKVAGDLEAAVDRAAEVVIAECVVRWHEQLREGGDDGFRAVLALAQHDPEREQLQRILLDLVRHPRFGQLAITCLGHVSRYDRKVLPEVPARLQELLDDPVLGGTAEDALGDIAIFAQLFFLHLPSSAWVVFAPPVDEEVAAQLTALREAGGTVRRLDARQFVFSDRFWKGSEARVERLWDRYDEWQARYPNTVFVIEHAEAAPFLPQLVDLLRTIPLNIVLEFDGDLGEVASLFDREHLTVAHKPPHLLVR